VPIIFELFSASQSKVAAKYLGRHAAAAAAAAAEHQVWSKCRKSVARKKEGAKPQEQWVQQRAWLVRRHQRQQQQLARAQTGNKVTTTSCKNEETTRRGCCHQSWGHDHLIKLIVITCLFAKFAQFPWVNFAPRKYFAGSHSGPTNLLRSPSSPS
jgi:hypothetical protein